MDEPRHASDPDVRILGKYRLIAELGRGGMARVHLAVAQGPAGFNKLLVVKQIDARYAEDPDFLAMFLDEARLAARLSHANIVQTYEIGSEGDQFFIAMEYLEGQPLNRILRRVGRAGVPLGMYIRVLVDVLAGLEYAHNLTDYDGTPLHVVHRDVTPHNVFITYGGQVKVVDFGIAKALDSTSETQKGVLKGKLAFMSPEQANCDHVDRRADVFAVGVTLWEALAGRSLWRGLGDLEILHRLTRGEIPSPRSVQPDIPPQLEAVCLRALAHRREERYPSAAAFQADLEALLDGLEQRSHRDLAKLVTHAFEAERATIQALVDANLRELKALSAPPLSPLSQPPDTAVKPWPRPAHPSSDSPAARPPSDAPAARPPSDAPAARPPSDAPAARPPSDAPAARERQSTLVGSSAGTEPPPPRRRARVALAIGLGISGCLAGGGAALLLGLGRGPASAEPAASAAPSAPEPAQPLLYTMVISSTPPGATVTEGGQRLGTTPMDLRLAADQKGARQLLIELTGYAATTIHQSPVREDGRIEVELVPLRSEPAAEQSATPSVPPPGPRRKPAPGPSSTTPAPAEPQRPPPGSIEFRRSR